MHLVLPCIKMVGYKLKEFFAEKTCHQQYEFHHNIHSHHYAEIFAKMKLLHNQSNVLSGALKGQCLQFFNKYGKKGKSKSSPSWL